MTCRTKALDRQSLESLQEVPDPSGTWRHHHHHQRPTKTLGRISADEYRIKLYPQRPRVAGSGTRGAVKAAISTKGTNEQQANSEQKNMHSVDQSSSRVIGNIQILRAFAASGVVILHSHATIFGVHTSFHGSALFFVTSGHLLSRIGDRSAAAFAVNRFWRIAPSYWLATALLLTLFNMWNY